MIGAYYKVAMKDGTEWTLRADFSNPRAELCFVDTDGVTHVSPYEADKHTPDSAAELLLKWRPNISVCTDVHATRQLQTKE
jgi:hypothetical protein